MTCKFLGTAAAMAPVLFVVATFSATPAAAQQYREAVYDYCIRQFYDREMYNWLSLQNSCPYALSVTYVGGNRNSSAADIGPNRKSSTGLSRQEVAERGGITVYVCPSGYLAVGDRDEYPPRSMSYRCKRRL